MEIQRSINSLSLRGASRRAQGLQAARRGAEVPCGRGNQAAGAGSSRPWQGGASRLGHGVVGRVGATGRGLVGRLSAETNGSRAQAAGCTGGPFPVTALMPVKGAALILVGGEVASSVSIPTTKKSL